MRALTIDVACAVVRCFVAVNSASMQTRYIQWLFPNYFQSQYNAAAPMLSKPGAHVFRNDAEIAGAPPKRLQSIFVCLRGVPLVLLACWSTLRKVHPVIPTFPGFLGTQARMAV